MLPSPSSSSPSPNNLPQPADDLLPRFPDVAAPNIDPVAGTSLPLTSLSSSSSSFAPPPDGVDDLDLAAEPFVTVTVTLATVTMLTTTTLPYPPPGATPLIATATAATIPPASTATATSTSTSTATAGAAAPPRPPPNPGECSLLGPFAILVQLALGALALLSLVWKRWRERPQRPVRIWFFDVSKQVFGSVLVHAANVFMSLLTSGRFSIEADAPVVAAGATVRMVRRAAVVAGAALGVVLGRAAEGAGADGDGKGGNGGGDGGDGNYVPNPCSFYLLNLAIDTTIGIPILIGIVRAITFLVSFTPLGSPPESIQSGNYGTPPNAWWWLKQSIIYFCGLMGMKLCVLFMFMALPWLPRVGDWALGWTEGNEKLQIVFVMMLFPLIMNALQYYIIDSYIKKQEARATAATAEGARSSITYEELLPASESDGETEEDEDEDDEEEATKKALNPRRGRARGTHVRLTSRDSSNPGRSSSVRGAATEYDPVVDGDSPTVVGSSSSRLSSRRSLPKEFPTE